MSFIYRLQKQKSIHLRTINYTKYLNSCHPKFHVQCHGEKKLVNWYAYICRLLWSHVIEQWEIRGQECSVSNQFFFYQSIITNLLHVLFHCFHLLVKSGDDDDETETWTITTKWLTKFEQSVVLYFIHIHTQIIHAKWLINQ